MSVPRAEPEHDDRKRMGMKVITSVVKRVLPLCDYCSVPPQALMLVTVLLFVTYYLKRSKWTLLKSRKIVYFDKGH